MTSSDLLTQAAQGLALHRLRTTLSATGIVFGVATVVAALAVGEGARREATEQIAALGINNVFARATGKGTAKAQGAPELTLEDAAALRDSVPGIVAVSAVRSIRTTITAPPIRREVVLAGVNVEWALVASAEVASGRWLTPNDLAERRRVVVLGYELARELFGDEMPIGRRVSMAGDWFEVAGVLSGQSVRSQSPAAAQRFDPNQIAAVPLAAMDARLGAGDALDRVEEIGLRAMAPDRVQAAAAAAAAILSRRHRGDADYEIVVPRELLRARLRALSTFNAVLMSIGALALLIGGIGIMNIMLASVAERTAEIGVRRAFGATRRIVVAQFALEAALLCVGGGSAGVAVGAMLAKAIAVLAGWPVSISAAGVAAALTMAASVGLAFGIYPAHMAGSVAPAEALRAP